MAAAAAGGESFQRLVGQEAGWLTRSDTSLMFSSQIQCRKQEVRSVFTATHGTKRQNILNQKHHQPEPDSVIRGRSHTVKLPSDQKQGSAVNHVAPPFFNTKTKLKIKKRAL